MYNMIGSILFELEMFIQSSVGRTFEFEKDYSSGAMKN